MLGVFAHRVVGFDTDNLFRQVSPGPRGQASTGPKVDHKSRTPAACQERKKLQQHRRRSGSVPVVVRGEAALVIPRPLEPRLQLLIHRNKRTADECSRTFPNGPSGARVVARKPSLSI